MNKKGAYTATKKNSAKGISLFEEAINATPDVTGKYQKGYTLVTDNIKHFERIKNLKIENWINR